MRSTRTIKWLAILVVAVVGLIGVAIITAPLIAATDLSKRRIAHQIEEWTGHPVTFSGEPTVKLFPFLSLTIADAKIGGDAADGKPFVSMDRLTCKLRLLPFLLGRAEVAEFRLERPKFHLTIDRDGNASWIPKNSSIAAEASKASTTPDQIAAIKLGKFTVFDGTIIYDDARDGRHETFDHLSLHLRWPELAKPVSGTGAFTWRKEVVEFNVSVGEPLKLIAGNSSPTRFGIASKPLRVSFTGTANSLADLQFEGETTVTAPSVRRVVEWLGVPMDNGPILGAGLIEGDLNWIGSSFTFPNARIELDGNVADGSLSVDLSGEHPRSQGTLALKKLDLSAYLEALQARITRDGGWQTAPIELPPLDVADLDFRLSAGEILIGSLRAGKTAAAVTLNGGRLDVNIGEAQFYGGQFEADGWIASNGGAVTGSARIAVKDTPAAAALADLAGLTVVDGTTAARIEVGAEASSWSDLAKTLHGTANVEITNGALLGFDLGQLAALSGAYNIADPAPGSSTVPITSLTASLALANGKITSDDIVAKGKTFTINLGGEINLFDLGIKGRGVLNAERATDGNRRRSVPFVVSGSWYAPFLLPDYERLIWRGTDDNKTSPPIGSAAQPTRPNG